MHVVSIAANRAATHRRRRTLDSAVPMTALTNPRTNRRFCLADLDVRRLAATMLHVPLILLA